MKTDANYTARLFACATLDDLKSLLADYAELAVDGGHVVSTMTPDDFTKFRRGLAMERRGRFAGEAWARQFAAVLMPLPMIRVSQIAHEFKVPFDVALRRVREIRPDVLKLEQSADAVRKRAERTA